MPEFETEFEPEFCRSKVLVILVNHIPCGNNEKPITHINIIPLMTGMTIKEGWHELVMNPQNFNEEIRWINRLESDFPNIEVVQIIGCDDGKRVLHWNKGF